MVCGASLALISGTAEEQPAAAPRLVDGQAVFRTANKDGSAPNPNDAIEDDEEAAAEAEAILAAIGRKPAYCADDLYRAAAGGNGSACFD